MNRRLILCLAVLAAVTVLPGRASAASFQGLGFLPDGTRSMSHGISADGSTVVGYCIQDGTKAYRWTAQTGMQGLGVLPGAYGSLARAVSADGSTVVGDSGDEAFRWRVGGGMEGLGFLPDYAASYARAVSADGLTVVGSSTTHDPEGSFYGQAFRWTVSGGMEGLGWISEPPDPGVSAMAKGVSADGSIICGYESEAGGIVRRAFRWTEVEGMVPLDFAEALAISADGSAIAGQKSRSESVRWTEQEGIVELGLLPGKTFSRAIDISADGSIVVGLAGWDAEAFIWNADHGMRLLQDVLVNDYGLDDQLAGWTLTEAARISDDGTVIAGQGINPDGLNEAWVVVIPEPSSIALVATGWLGLLAFARRRRWRDRRER